MCADLLKRVRASESVGVCVQIHTAKWYNNTLNSCVCWSTGQAGGTWRGLCHTWGTVDNMGLA